MPIVKEAKYMNIYHHRNAYGLGVMVERMNLCNDEGTQHRMHLSVRVHLFTFTLSVWIPLEKWRSF